MEQHLENAQGHWSKDTQQQFQQMQTTRQQLLQGARRESRWRASVGPMHEG